jgi:hypothetical protein
MNNSERKRNLEETPPFNLTEPLEHEVHPGKYRKWDEKLSNRQ